MWRDLNNNNQARTKIMESTLFTALSTNEEANLSGGAKKVKIRGGDATGGAGGAGGAGGPGFGGVVLIKKSIVADSTVSADGLGGNGGTGGAGGDATGGAGIDLSS